MMNGRLQSEGRTWSQPIKTAMWGFPAHLLELRDGRILCTYGYRRKPYGVRASISKDGARLGMSRT